MLGELIMAHAGQMYFSWLCHPQERAVIQQCEIRALEEQHCRGGGTTEQQAACRHFSHIL